MSDADAEATQRIAISQIEELLKALMVAGWDFAAVSLWRRTSGDAGGAGASTFDVRTSMLPALPRLADNLRVLARELDDLHRKSGAAEMLEGYTHVISREGKTL